MPELVKGWATLSKDGGTGTETLVASATQHTGRVARSVTFTVSPTTTGPSPVQRTINQQAKPEFVSFDNATPQVDKAGGSVTITGKSNSSKLTFSLGTGTLVLTLPSTYSAGGVTTNNDTAITGDPGATQEYAFAITFTGIAANTTVNTKSIQLSVAPNAGTAATCQIEQTAADATLTVTPESVTIPWDASETKTFTVNSNISWTVS